MTIDPRRERNRAAIAKAKSGPCTDCGLSFPLHQMWLFHVTDDKKFAIGSSCDRSCRAVLLEIQKCVLVCYKCGPIRSAANEAKSLELRRSMALPRTMSMDPERAGEVLTRMLRRNANRIDMRERRRRDKGQLAIDNTVVGVSPSPYDDTGDT